MILLVASSAPPLLTRRLAALIEARIALRPVDSSQLEIGRFYAYREKRKPGTEMLKVKLLAHTGRSGKLKVRFEDGPFPGLEDYVASRQLICPWGQRRDVLRDEERAARLEEYVDRSGIADRALIEATSAVLASTGEPGAAAAAVTAMDEGEWQRIFDRAGIDGSPLDVHPLAYRDRYGMVHMPLEAAIGVAKAFAASEPGAVTMYLDDREEEYRLRGSQPGDRFFHDYLRELSPGFALARRWAGLEQEADALREEIARLRVLLNRAAYDLRDAGKDQQARRLLRALEGR
jgi:hypothetical protein